MRLHLDSKPHLVGDVEAFVRVVECVSLFESLFPGHASVHTDLQGTTKRPHQKWDNYRETEIKHRDKSLPTLRRSRERKVTLGGT